MPFSAGDDRGRGPRRGFAVLLVLWALILMALIAGRMTLAGRAEAEGAARLKLAAVAEAAADGAVYDAISHIMRKDPRWVTDRNPHELTIGHSAIEVRLEDEAGKINPNVAPPELLAALLMAAGIDNARAADLSRAIVDWRNAKPTAEEIARSNAAYRMSGLAYTPAHEPFHFLDQLGAVIGMSPAVLRTLAPHLTLYDDKGPVAPRADTIVRAAMRLANAGQELPAAAAQDQVVFTIRAHAAGPQDIAFNRRAVVEVDGKGNYAILLWDIDPQI